ncbi:MAG: hypothetical protein IKL53_01890 [Lachnospiraceae bacterium]|nr:hypothetical protein [Lachnospiraceae bacterium]
MDNNNNNFVPEDVTGMVDDVINQDPAAELASKMEQDLGMDMPNPTPAVDPDGDEATAEQPAIPGVPPVEEEVAQGDLKLADSQPVQPQMGMGQTNNQMNGQQFGQLEMGGVNPQFGQPQMGAVNPQFGQPQMGGMNPQFGQPQMGGANPQFGQPPYGQPVKPKKVKKPLSKGAIGGIIGGGIALIALIVCAIIFLPKLFPTDKEVIVDAFEATFGVEADGEVEDIYGLEEINDKFATTGGKREYYFEVVDATSDMSLDMTITENIDVANRLANVEGIIASEDTTLIDFVGIVDDDKVYMQLKDLIDGYFLVPSKNMLQAMENSVLGQGMDMSGMPEFDLADAYFNLSTSSAPTELNSEYVAIYDKLWDSILYEKQGKATVSVNGKDVKAKEYFITVPEDSIKEAINSTWDAAIAELSSDPAYLEAMGMDAATFESTMAPYGSMLSSLVQGDFVIKVYIKGDEVVKIICADEINIYGTAITYDMQVDVDDEKASGIFDFSVMGESVGLKFEVDGLDESPAGKISVYAAGETIDVNFTSDVKDTDAADSINMNYDVVYNGTSYVTGDVVMNEGDDNSFDGYFSANIADAGEIKVGFAGKNADINKGVSYKVVLDEAYVEADGEKLITMNGYLSVDASQHTANGIDSSLPVYDLQTLTEDELDAIIEENMDKLEPWVQTIDSFLGIESPTIEPDTTVVEEPEVEDNMTLTTSTKTVEILGTIPGFEFYMSSDSYVYFETEQWSYVEYSLQEGFTPEEIVSGIYVPETDVLAQEIGQTMDYNGETIYYSYVQDEEFGYKYSAYMFAKDLGDGTVLVVDCGVYDDDETITKEQLVEAFNPQYYTVK